MIVILLICFIVNNDLMMIDLLMITGVIHSIFTAAGASQQILLGVCRSRF